MSMTYKSPQITLDCVFSRVKINASFDVALISRKSKDMDNTTDYYVNGEKQQTAEHKLTVAQILDNAGFKPPEQYTLTRDDGNHAYKDYSEEVPIHKDERFTALFIGVTPTS